MIASPSTPNTPIANLTVIWSGVPNPQSNYWIAIYCTDAPLSGFQEWNYVSVSALLALDFIKVIAYVKYLLLDRFLH